MGEGTGERLFVKASRTTTSTETMSEGRSDATQGNNLRGGVDMLHHILASNTILKVFPQKQKHEYFIYILHTHTTYLQHIQPRYIQL